MSIFTDAFRSIASVGKILLLSKWSGALKLNTKPQRHQCVIIGNGPSVSTTFNKYSDILKEYDLVCVNSFVTTDYFNSLQPGYYILAAPTFFHPDHMISTAYIKIKQDIFEALANKTTHQMFLLVPFIARNSTDFRRLLSRNTNLKPLYFNHTPIEGLSFLSQIFFSMKLGLPRPHNVLIPAIMSMIQIGYKEIFLVGADHSWLPEITVTEQNEALIQLKHFYDENESRPEKMLDYIIRPRRLHEIIYKIYLSFRGYWDIKKYADSKHVNIYNASEYSMIDAFDRKKLS